MTPGGGTASPPSGRGAPGVTHMDQQPVRVAVLGGRGMLGSDMLPALRAAGYAATALDLPEFDITRTADLRRAVEHDVLVNCAAFTNVDGAESAAAQAEAVNATAVGTLGSLAAAHKRTVLHISTDFVFDGRLDRPYTEEDAPNPISVYGATKLAGERALFASGCRGAVVRVQWTYGAGGAHFVSKLLARARTASELRVVADQVGSPTWTRDVAAAVVELLRIGASGVYHCAAAGQASRFEVAREVLAALHLTIPVHPCRTADFPTAARRPLNSRFDCRKLERTLGHGQRDWRTALREFLTVGGGGLEPPRSETGKET